MCFFGTMIACMRITKGGQLVYFGRTTTDNFFYEQGKVIKQGSDNQGLTNKGKGLWQTN
jgi:hypothetical protein